MRIAFFWGTMIGLSRRVLLLLCACEFGIWGATRFDVQWAPELALSDISHVQERLKKPFDSPISLMHAGKTSECDNCASLLQLQGSGFAAASDRDAQVVQALAVECLAIQALRDARPASTSFLRGVRWDPQILALLPPGLAPAVSREDRDRAQKATAEGRSWKQFDPSAAASLDGDDLAVLTDDMRTLIKVYGRGDFTGDGIDDLLLRVDTAALHGSYRTSRLFLLTRSSANAPLRIVRELK